MMSQRAEEGASVFTAFLQAWESDTRKPAWRRADLGTKKGHGWQGVGVRGRTPKPVLPCVGGSHLDRGYVAILLVWLSPSPRLTAPELGSQPLHTGALDLRVTGDSWPGVLHLPKGAQRSGPHRSCRRLGVLQRTVLLSWSNA